MQMLDSLSPVFLVASESVHVRVENKIAVVCQRSKFVDTPKL